MGGDVIVSRAAIDFTATWFDWFVKTRPESGKYLKGGTSGTLSWATVTAGGPEGVFYAHDYATLQDAVDAAKGATLILDASFDITAPVTLHGSTYDGTAIIGVNRYDNVITATGAIGAGLGMLDVRADYVRLANFTLDGGSQANTGGLYIGTIPGDGTDAARFGRVDSLIIQNTSSGEDIIRFREDVDWWYLYDIRALIGIAGYGIHFYTPAGCAYNNGHIYFFGGNFGPLKEAVRRTVVDASYQRIGFYGCQFATSKSGTYMLDLSYINDIGFFDCDFELETADPPGTAVVYFLGNGQGFFNCFFSGQANNTTVFKGQGIGAPYTVLNCHLYNFGETAVGFSGSRFFGAESTIWDTFGGTEYATSASGTIEYVSQAAQPTCDHNGEIKIWHDTDDNKIYLVARGNNGDKAHELP